MTLVMIPLLPWSALMGLPAAFIPLMCPAVGLSAGPFAALPRWGSKLSCRAVSLRSTTIMLPVLQDL